MIRINKYLSICGVCSRRGAEELVREGRVSVNGTRIDKLGTIIDEKNDVVTVDGITARPVEKNYYVLLNKPRDVITSVTDPYRRRTVTHFTRRLPARIYPVGRLDFDTEGVLLLTNDGELAYRLAHPKYRIRRVYQALVKGPFASEDAEAIARGIKLSDGHTGKARTKIMTTGINSSKVELILTEGHKREVKQLLKAVGHPVIRLRRVEFAGLRVNGLRVGRWRHLNANEIAHLKRLVDLT